MLLLRGMLLIPLLPAKDIPLPPARRVRVQPLWLLRHSLVLLRVSRLLLLHLLLRLRPLLSLPALFLGTFPMLPRWPREKCGLLPRYLLKGCASPPELSSPSSQQVWNRLLRPLLLL